MKFKFLLLSITFALLASACTNTRYAANGEYDDVYFTSADRSAQVASADLEGPDVYGTNEDERRFSSNTSRDNYRVNSYRDEVYDEDDFYFSRRLRRFGSASSSAWRYYDPYYSNDLYYVMGTPAWSNWRNNGWYSWNRPRFGASLNWGYLNDPFYGGIYDTWGMNYGNYYNYYNPWVSTYYGYNPAFGYSPFGFGNRFGGFGFGNFGYGYGSAFYCPPYAYTTGAAGFASSRSRSWDRYYTARRQSSTSSVRTNTGYGSSSRVSPTNATTGRRQAARPAGYTSTRTNRTANSGMYLAPKARTQTIGNRANVTTNTSTNSTRPTNARPANRTSPRVYTRPNNTVNTRTNTTGSSLNRRSNARTNNTSARPSNSNRTYSRPSNRTYSRPSNSNRTYSRPSNTSRTRTYSRPSNSSRPASSMSRPSSSRPSSSMSRPSSSSSRSSSARPSSSSSSRRPSGSRSSSSSSSSRVRP